MKTNKQQFNILSFEEPETNSRPLSSRNRPPSSSPLPHLNPIEDPPPRKNGRGAANLSGTHYNIVNFEDNGTMPPPSPGRGKKIFQQSDRDMSFQSRRAYQERVDQQDLDQQRVDKKIDALHNYNDFSSPAATNTVEKSPVPVPTPTASPPPEQPPQRTGLVRTSVRISRHDDRNFNIITGE